MPRYKGLICLNRLFDLIKSRSLIQSETELAELLDLNRGSLFAYRNGTRKPSVKVLLRLYFLKGISFKQAAWNILHRHEHPLSAEIGLRTLLRSGGSFNEAFHPVFSPGDIVAWSSSSIGLEKLKIGIIVEVVDPCKRVPRTYSERGDDLFKMSHYSYRDFCLDSISKSGARSDISFLVRSFTFDSRMKRHLYWPLVDNLWDCSLRRCNKYLRATQLDCF